MTEKRYVIVRVDGNCPNKLENLSAPCITSRKRFDCNNCRYGDNKEQLVKKIAQIIKIKLKADYVTGLKDTVFTTEMYCVERLAEEIIKFLGVEE